MFVCILLNIILCKYIESNSMHAYIYLANKVESDIYLNIIDLSSIKLYSYLG